MNFCFNWWRASSFITCFPSYFPFCNVPYHIQLRHKWWMNATVPSLSEEGLTTLKGVIKRRTSKNRQHNDKKGQTEKQWWRSHTQKNPHRFSNMKRSSLNLVGKCGCSGRMDTSCSNNGIRRVNQIKNAVTRYERWKKRGIVIVINGIYLWSTVIRHFL